MIKQKNNKGLTRRSTTEGFTLLFASLIGALVLAVGLAILSITLKQLTLASASRATQQSFYSADAGTECALYLDRGAGISGCQLGFFYAPTTTLSFHSDNGYGAYSCLDDVDYIPDDGVSLDKIRCMGRLISLNSSNSGEPIIQTNGDVTSYFTLETGTGTSGDTDSKNDDMCFAVSMTKKAVDGSTVIESRGYNTCKDAANKFERAIRTTNQ